MCMCQVALAEHWTEVYGPKGVGFYTMHPGWVDTEIIKRNMPSFYSMVQTSLRSSDQGADTIVWLALQPNSSLQNGAFYFDRAVAPKHLKDFRTGYTNQKVSAVVSKIGSLCGLNHISKSQ
jgi:dehydrogenase/reductase SDR family protein 12